MTTETLKQKNVIVGGIRDIKTQLALLFGVLIKVYTASDYVVIGNNFVTW